MLPFSVGEQIQYSVSWEMIRAGKANVRILPFTTLKGKKAYHFLLEVKSSRYIDIFYKIRDRLEGFSNIELSHSLLYKKTQSGKDKRQVIVDFDWEKKTATYSNFGEKRAPIEIPLGTFDPVSAFYRMRTLNLKVDQSLSFPVSDGKKGFIQKCEVIKKEKIILPSGTFDPNQVDSLIVVDANNWKRLDRMEILSKKQALEIICWDHHMEGDTIGGTEVHREEVGATITLLLEEMQRWDTAFTPMHATLFLLGIYDDTMQPVKKFWWRRSCLSRTCLWLIRK